MHGIMKGEAIGLESKPGVEVYVYLIWISEKASYLFYGERPACGKLQTGKSASLSKRLYKWRYKPLT
jgi:hypothetical protein